MGKAASATNTLYFALTELTKRLLKISGIILISIIPVIIFVCFWFISIYLLAPHFFKTNPLWIVRVLAEPARGLCLARQTKQLDVPSGEIASQ